MNSSSHYRAVWRVPVVALVAGGVVALAGRGRVRRIEVAGPSMIPTLAPGERLLVVPRWRGLERGDLVALRDPDLPSRLLIKRVEAVSRSRVFVRGDNEGASRDSREFGAVSLGSIVGLAVYRYYPAARAGGLTGRRPHPPAAPQSRNTQFETVE